jgi:hypothetical protein
MAEWKEYTGSDEQIAEMSNAKYGWICRYSNGEVSYIFDSKNNIKDNFFKDIFTNTNYYPTHYLICEPHPYREMIKRWIDTGEPVFVKINDYTKSRYITLNPDWNLSNAEYSFAPFDWFNVSDLRYLQDKIKRKIKSE